MYAEDTQNGFLPDTGTITRYKIPSGPGIRVDDGLQEGSEVSIFYDPMIAKLIAYSSNRSEAIVKLKNAIQDYTIIGVETTLPFCDFVLNQKDFIAGNFDTNFVAKHYHPENNFGTDSEEEKIAAIFAAYLKENQSENSVMLAPNPENNSSKWKSRKYTI